MKSQKKMLIFTTLDMWQSKIPNTQKIMVSNCVKWCQTLLLVKWRGTLKKLMEANIWGWFLLMKAKKQWKNTKNCGEKLDI